MQHFPVTDINPAMAHARRVIGAFEEHQITGFGRTGRRTDVIEPLGSQPAHIPAGVIDDPRNVPRAIKGSGRRTASPHIGIADVFLRFGKHCSKGFIVQIFSGHFVITGFPGNVLVHIGRIWEQIGAISQRCHIDGISGKLILAHNVHRYMGQIKIFQRDRTDVIIVRHLIGVRMGVAVLVRPCVGFRAIPGFHHHILGQNVLAVKEHLQRSLYLAYCPLSLMERTQKRKQHIGIMFDFVQIEVVFVIVMGAFIGVQIML